MKIRFVVLASLALFGCSASPPQSKESPVGPASLEDPNQRAAAYLGALAAWTDAPGLLLKECTSVDVKGDSERQAAYDKWRMENKANIERAKDYEKQIVPLLYPQVPGLPGDDPVLEAYRAHTTIDLSRRIYFMPPERKKALCADFPSSQFLKALPDIGNEAFVYLEQWKQTHAASK